jgi:hypothetical protein
MAFELKSEPIEEQDGCKEWYFIDGTGNYNATDNLTGFGAPNIASADVTQATIYILPYGYTTGWLLTFTIVSNVITAATSTAPDGTIANILSQLTSTVFPFSETDPLVIIGEWLGMGEDSQITSSVYNIEYVITGPSFVQYSTSRDELIVCTVCCCVRNAASDLQGGDCKCQDEKIENAMRAEINLQAAIWAIENAESDKAQTLLLEAKRLCEGKCNGCN